MTADRALAEVLAELLAPAIREAVSEAVRAAAVEAVRPETEPLLTVTEAAEIANCHPETIRRAIKAGRLRAVTSLGRHPRLRRQVLEDFLSERETP